MMKSSRYLEKKYVRASNSLLAVAVVAFVLGIVALVYPQTVGEISTKFIGALLVLGGILRALLTGAAFSFSTLFVRWSYALVMIAAGIWLFANSDVGLEVLTVMMAIYFILEGVIAIIYALSLIPFGGGHWVLINGSIGIVLGVLIFYKWPQSSIFTLGIYLGLKMILDGIALGITAFVLKKWVRSAAKYAS